MSNLEKNYDIFLNKVKESKNIVITRHIGPDGDCMGAQYALYHFIKNNFADKKVFCEGGKAKNYLRTLFPMEKAYKKEHEVSDYDLQILVDTSAKERVDGELLSQDKVFIIDHHSKQDKIALNEIRDSKQPSVCQIIATMLFYFVDKYGLTMDKKIAKCLFIGIVTDTNRMWYQASSELFTICSRLLQFNIDTKKIYEEIFYWGLDEIRFRNDMINKAKIKDNLITVVLEPNEYNKFNLDYETAKDLALSLVEVKPAEYFVIAVKNSVSNKYHVSLRSKNLRIDNIAMKYGGGGHRRASGVRVPNKEILGQLISDIKNINSNRI